MTILDEHTAQRSDRSEASLAFAAGQTALPVTEKAEPVLPAADGAAPALSGADGAAPALSGADGAEPALPAADAADDAEPGRSWWRWVPLILLLLGIVVGLMLMQPLGAGAAGGCGGG